MININRKDFLKQTGIGILGVVFGKFIYNELFQYYKKSNEKLIYTSLSKHLHQVNYSGYVNVNNETHRLEQTGMGILYKDFYITMNHIADLSKVTKRGVFGNYTQRYELEDFKATLNGKPLEKIILDEQNDVAIFDASNLNMPNFPCKPENNTRLGDEVYLIGNPGLRGLNIRKGRIVDLDGLNDDPGMNKENFFGTDINIIGGDSGCPLVDSNFKLLGLTSYYYGGFSYYSKIENFMKYIK